MTVTALLEKNNLKRKYKETSTQVNQTSFPLVLLVPSKAPSGIIYLLTYRIIIMLPVVNTNYVK